ncbi:cytochrome c oxidase subunit 6C [Pogona vitticeps]|uniref:Cytochrome c oxidase subunit 6C n=1 Tax=Pogona vitticeps TaxID=103695 RepID=A0ABM5GCA5_9SAUR|nr:cytochrome c oxidase subunit 6C [Pogona vitticeps]
MSALLPKPQMRNLLAKRTRIFSSIGAAITVLVSVSYWYFIAENRAKVYAEFYRTYDPQKDFEEMRKAGVFQNVPPDD